MREGVVYMPGGAIAPPVFKNELEEGTERY